MYIYIYIYIYMYTYIHIYGIQLARDVGRVNVGARFFWHRLRYFLHPALHVVVCIS